MDLDNRKMKTHPPSPESSLKGKIKDFFLIGWFLTATSGTKPIIVFTGHVYILLHQLEKRGSSIQYGYRKRGTHARLFSLTPTHGNSKNEIRTIKQTKTVRREGRLWNEVKRARKNKYRRPTTI